MTIIIIFFNDYWPVQAIFCDNINFIFFSEIYFYKLQIYQHIVVRKYYPMNATKEAVTFRFCFFFFFVDI